jgi:hypothetical protein
MRIIYLGGPKVYEPETQSKTGEPLWIHSHRPKIGKSVALDQTQDAEMRRITLKKCTIEKNGT